MSVQGPIYMWCRNHRLHHKYSETEADPHNINRGFFFGHMGWAFLRRRPQVIEAGFKTIIIRITI
jgi:stearoyl-CoA desaturase (delta-9 desaturase)